MVSYFRFRYSDVVLQISILGNRQDKLTKSKTKMDNVLFAGLVLTLPAFFGWGIKSVWWIKLATAIAEMAVVATWLRWELQRVRSTMVFDFVAAELQCS